MSTLTSRSLGKYVIRSLRSVASRIPEPFAFANHLSMGSDEFCPEHKRANSSVYIPPFASRSKVDIHLKYRSVLTSLATLRNRFASRNRLRFSSEVGIAFTA